MTDQFDYLIVGGGMTAAAAAQGIREIDEHGSIAIVGDEMDRPYNRPPLTKKLWQGKAEDSIWRDLPDRALELLLGRYVDRLAPDKKEVFDTQGHAYGYRKLLLATGGSPRRLRFTPPETVYYRTLRDYHTVRGWAAKEARIGILGGGFIGSEIAAALTMNGAQAVEIFPEEAIGARIFPPDLADNITQYYRDKGVEVHAGVSIQGVEYQKDGFLLRGDNGSIILVDHLIAGIGITPNISLAKSAGLKIASPAEGGGIWVDKYTGTSQEDIFAAGDAASFHHLALQQYLRVEHEDNANAMGRVAGLNMAGQKVAYTHQPYFYSDLFDLGYEAVGDLDPSLDIVSDWQEPFRKGVVYYLKERKVRGVLLWNTWDQVDAAREIIAEGAAFSASDLMGRISS